MKRAQEAEGPDWGTSIEAAVFVAKVAALFGVEVEDLRSRRRSVELVRARENIALLAVERYGLKVKDLAQEIRKAPSGMAQALARAARQRAVDTKYQAELSRMDATIAASVL